MKINAVKMAAAADRACALLKSVGHRHRLLILCQLIDGERSVGELAGFLAIRDSTVSQHLQILRRDGLVAPRREAQTIWYSLASAPAHRLLRTLFEIYCPPETVAAPAPAGAKPPAVRDGRR